MQIPHSSASLVALMTPTGVPGGTSTPPSTSATASSDAIAAPAPTAPVVATGDTPKTGDGPLITAMRNVMVDNGFAMQPGESKHAQLARRHAFSDALFGALHAQRAADRASGTVDASGNGEASQALSELASAATAGNAPADLQAAFDALQPPAASAPGGSGSDTGTGASSGAGPVTLASILQQMSAAVSGMQAQNGSLLDASA